MANGSGIVQFLSITDVDKQEFHKFSRVFVLEKKISTDSSVG